MYCGQCGNRIEKNDKFCQNCGFKQIYNEIESNKESSTIENKKEDKSKVIKFILIRTLISIISLVPFLLSLLVFQTHIGLALIIAIIIYLTLSILLNKFIKFQDFSYYMLTNFISVILTFIFNFCIAIFYYNIALSNAGDAGGWSFVFIVLIFIALSINTFIINIVIDLVINKKIKKQLKL